MVDLKKWMTKVSEKLAVLNTGYQHKAMNKSVAKATQETVGTVTLTKGLWVVVSYMKISNTGNSVYNHLIDGQITRSMETNGGGNINVRFYQVASESQTVNIQAYVTSFATTVTGDVWAIKLGGWVISYLIHLTESLKSFCGGRRWAYAEPQEGADEAVCTGDAREDHIYADKWERICQLWRMLLRADGVSRKGASGYQRTNSRYKYNGVSDANRTETQRSYGGEWLREWSFCYLNRTNRHLRDYTSEVIDYNLQCRHLLHNLTPAPERGWWCA